MVEKQICKSCGTVLEENAVHCSECGLSTMIEEDIMKELLKQQNVLKKRQQRQAQN